MSRWFRMYSDVLDDPKVQKLPPVVFKVWVNLLCLAGRNDGVLPGIEDIAFALRIDEGVTRDMVRDLIQRGLLDEGDGLSPHNWAERQFKSDKDQTATERKRAQRAREKQADTTVDVTRDVTDESQPPEQSRTEADSEHNTQRACVRESDPEHWKLVHDILERQSGALNTWEDEFLTSIKWAFDLSKAQRDKLKAISDRLQATDGATHTMWTIKRGSIQYDEWLGYFRKRGSAKFYESRDTLTVPTEYPPQEQAA